MLSSTPDYVMSHVRDRTLSANSFDRARHGQDLAARQGRARRARLGQYAVAIYHALIRS